jgi:hypothetical protein
LVTVEPAMTDAAAAVPSVGAVADQAGDAPKAMVSTPAEKIARLNLSVPAMLRNG